MKRWPNGEPITKERIEKEKWYPAYQSLMEIAIHIKEFNDESIDQLLDKFKQDNQDCLDVFGVTDEQYLRWAVLQITLREVYISDFE